MSERFEIYEVTPKPNGGFNFMGNPITTRRLLAEAKIAIDRIRNSNPVGLTNRQFVIFDHDELLVINY